MDANSSCRASCLLVRDFFSIALFTGDYLKALRRSSLITSFYQLWARFATPSAQRRASVIARARLTH
jgi:hypothetical protein